MPSPPASFAGRLCLDDFKYSPSSPPVPLRSPAQPPSAAPPAPSPRPRPRPPRHRAAYAPPSTYAHLPLLPDALGPNLLVLFVGLNPGLKTARDGHAYAHPSNLFWKLLASSSITPSLCRPEDDARLPALYSLGLTNIVSRPTRNGAELSPRELDAGVSLLEEKCRRWRPESICLVGKGIWEAVWRVRHRRPVGHHFCYGWQQPSENMGRIDGQWPGAAVFVAPSTSGLAATLSMADKKAIWAQLGSWVQTRRSQRELESADKPASSISEHEPSPHPTKSPSTGE